MPEEKIMKGTIKWGDGREETIESKVLVATKEENLASLERHPFFIATIDYFATGEGMTLEVIAGRAENEEIFKQKVADNSMGGSFYAMCARIYKNEIPEGCYIFDNLVSDSMKKRLQSYVSGETETGYFLYRASSYQNLS